MGVILTRGRVLANPGGRTRGGNEQNRPTQVSGSGSLVLAYDPASRLYQTNAGGGVPTRMLYDGADVIAEYDTAGALLRRYVHGAGEDEPLVSYDSAGNSSWLLADAQGSIIALTNVAGAATAINTYDEYGRPGASNSGYFQYTGQGWLAQAGLYNYKARVYDPKIGRFLQTDPISYAGGLNLYAYAGNDPVNGSDPSGLIDFDCDPDGVCVIGPRREYSYTTPSGIAFGVGGGDATGTGNSAPGPTPGPSATPPTSLKQAKGRSTKCLSVKDGPLEFAGGGIDLVLGIGAGFGVYKFWTPSGISGVVASGGAFAGLGGSAGGAYGQVRTVGDFLGAGYRFDFEVPAFGPAGGAEVIYNSAQQEVGAAGTLSGGGGAYFGKTKTKLLSSSAPLC